MNYFMVQAELPAPFPDEFIQNIPRQRAKINKQLEAGKLTNYSLAEDFSVLWATVHAADEDAAMEIVAEWPLALYMDFEITPLIFHNNNAFVMPQFSWN